MHQRRRGEKETPFTGLKKFDAYAKTLDDFRVKTSTGAIVTIACGIIIVILFLGEYFNYRSVHVESSLIVDTGKKERMDIVLDITFPKIPCYILTLDVMDVAGAHQNDIEHSVYKIQLSPEGVELKREKTIELGDSEVDPKEVGKNYCGECGGAQPPESGCCNTCEEVRQAYARSGWSFNRPDKIEQCVREGYMQKIKEQANQGCRIRGNIRVNKVAGNFHVAPGKSFQRGAAHVHDIVQYLEQGLDFSHEINRLSFGVQVPGLQIKNPLDGQVVQGNIQQGELYMFQYYLKVVGTRYLSLKNPPVLTNQFSVTQFNRNLQYKDDNGNIRPPSGLPGVFFNFDISPMVVVQKEERKSFASFLTTVCAIVGGIFTVFSLLDGFIWRAERSLRRKIEIGKAL
ncbi:endoplasmic reticulum-Golgi intermediate compartment protein 3 [Entomortierella parvispora]|uniref:Endoplasmic reticulum-Golgi intermediate compartment protein 3 n=1 Tax=Entomortierella parvispora TaxID=205924 RepID=A0A9P3H2X7_9FUNG|nr:endoplasmic reticulum-Golgi intermediate compartment protein 3 [Entomortierella parvispora]